MNDERQLRKETVRAAFAAAWPAFMSIGEVATMVQERCEFDDEEAAMVIVLEALHEYGGEGCEDNAAETDGQLPSVADCRFRIPPVSEYRDGKGCTQRVVDAINALPAGSEETECRLLVKLAAAMPEEDPDNIGRGIKNVWLMKAYRKKVYTGKNERGALVWGPVRE